MPQCAGIKRDGGRCTVVVGLGQTHCYQHDPDKVEERRRNASRGGRSKGNSEIPALKRQLKDLAQDVLSGKVDRSRAAVANQILNTLLRAIEQERKVRELEEVIERMDALEHVLKERNTA